jgi:hypothetical protein
VIQAACGECGARFRVKPEHAGRRTRCPKCGEVMQIPELPADEDVDEAEDEQPTEAPAKAPVRAGAGRSSRRPSTTTRRAGSGGRRKASPSAARTERPTRRAKSEGKDPAFVARIAVGLIVVVGAVIAWMVMGGTDHAAVFQQGVEAMSAGKHQIAIERFTSIPEGHGLYGRAQEKIVEATELAGAEEVRFDTRQADNLWAVVESMRIDYVDGTGPNHPEYAPNCRYMLKRAKEFIDTYPDDPRVVEARGLFPYYSQVANLDWPLTEADVRAEVRMRTLTHKFRAALAPIAEFEELTGDKDVAEEMRADLRKAALAYWKREKENLGRRGAFDEGDENWRQISNRATRYLDDVDGLTGVSADAIALRDQANAALDSGG